MCKQKQGLTSHVDWHVTRDVSPRTDILCVGIVRCVDGIKKLEKPKN